MGVKKYEKPAKKKMMLAALEKNLGIVSIACRIVGIDRGTHSVWVSNDPEYRAAVEAIALIELDFVVSKLHKKISDGDTMSIIYYLNKKGAAAGYGENKGQKPATEESTPVVFNNTYPIGDE